MRYWEKCSSMKSWLKRYQTSPGQKTVILWIEVIMEKSLPISFIKNSTMQSFCKHNFERIIPKISQNMGCFGESWSPKGYGQ